MKERYPFMIDRTEHGVIVSMDFDGFIRARTMSEDLLQSMAKVCRHAFTEIIPEAKVNQELQNALPDPESSLVIAKGRCGPSEVRIHASRDEDGETEFMVVFYDEDDESNPVILLVDEQIKEFAMEVLCPKIAF